MAADRLRTLGEMAAAIAHELNQPLVGARGLAEHLLIGMDRGWDIPPAKVRERLTLIIEQADRMAHIIERVRMFAREAGKLEVHPVQLNDVVRAALGMVGEHFRARGIALECELAESLPPVPANPFSLEEVVLNLITNARDAIVEKIEKAAGPGPSATQGTGFPGAPPAAPPPPARILIRTLARSCAAADCQVIEVVDEGIGIPPENLTRIFEPFFTTKPPNRGTGIGLAVCKHIVEQFGGTIEIQSQPGRGATVAIVLPVRRSGIESSGPAPHRASSGNAA
jgi:histidine kinase